MFGMMSTLLQTTSNSSINKNISGSTLDVASSIARCSSSKLSIGFLNIAFIRYGTKRNQEGSNRAIGVAPMMMHFSATPKELL
jgi:hypothetical protein